MTCICNILLVFSATGGTAPHTNNTQLYVAILRRLERVAHTPFLLSRTFASLSHRDLCATCDDRRGTEKNFKKEQYLAGTSSALLGQESPRGMTTWPARAVCTTFRARLTTPEVRCTNQICTQMALRKKRSVTYSTISEVSIRKSSRWTTERHFFCRKCSLGMSL